MPANEKNHEHNTNGTNGQFSVPFQVHKELREQLVKSFDRYVERTKEKETLSGYINQVIIRRFLEREEIVKKVYPYLECLTVLNNELHIKNNLVNSLFQVSRDKKNRLKCTQDNSYNCEHVLYAHASVNFAKLYQT